MPHLTAWLLMHPVEDLDDLQLRLRETLCQMGDDIQTASELVHAFCAMVRSRIADTLDSWLEQAPASALKVLQTFAEGLQSRRLRPRLGRWAPRALLWANGSTVMARRFNASLTSILCSV